VIKLLSVRIVQKFKVMSENLDINQVFTVKFLSRNVCDFLVSSLRVLCKHIGRPLRSIVRHVSAPTVLNRCIFLFQIYVQNYVGQL